MAAKPTFVESEALGPTFVETGRSGPTFVEAHATRPVFDESVAVFSSATGGGDVIAGGSATPTSGAGTLYMGLLGDPTESVVQIPVPAFTARRLHVRRTAAPGSARACTYTLRRNGSDTGLIVTLGAADTSGSSPVNTTVAFNAGDRLSVSELRSGDVIVGVVNFSVDGQYQS